jgi:aspartyl-tRNA(Asn)/glutamyl-tRNA(Gln) amidotransferase subunit B
MEWETVIGLEIHAQLATRSKIFSGAATAYGAEPNTQACAIDLAMPGVLPVLNKSAVSMAIKFGLSVDADIAPISVFARKNYFYPDLPKGYQISQFELPIVKKGHLDVVLDDGTVKRIGITRAHLEEDAGKSLHEDFNGMTGVDFNRAGTPLLEIVSEPDMRTPQEAIAYLKAVHALVRYIEICDGNMQEGSFRCDANVSVRPKGQKEFGTRAEIKNVNSFRFVEKAIQYEVERQIALIESGGVVQQETRLYDADTNTTRAMRSKEDANDYRYFPDPDLLPLAVDQAWIDTIRAQLPELPAQKRARFQKDFDFSHYDANILVNSKELAQYFEDTVQQTKAPAKLVANWIMGDLAAALNKHNLDITASPVSTIQLAGLLERIHDQTISGKIAKDIFEKLWAGAESADAVIDQQGLRQITDDSAIIALIETVMAANPQQLAEYRSGKDRLLGFFVGQVMKLSQGKANPEQLNTLLLEKLKT